MTDSAKRISGELYFATMTVVDWIDIFIRPKYKHIILDSFSYCQREKGLKIHAWVLMSNHLHAIIRSEGALPVSDIVRDFKKFTSKEVLKELAKDPLESRRDWMLSHFRFAGNCDKKATNYRFWQDGYHPELIYSYDFFLQKLEYIHNNPVKQEIVCKPEEYLYSSAIDYAGEKGLLEIDIIP